MQVSLVVFTVLFSVAVVAAWPEPAPKCPKNWSMFNGTSCLQLFKMKEPWHEARRQCKFNQADADLVVVNTEEKKSYVHTMVHAKPPLFSCGITGISEYWIGGHDSHKEGRFEWLDTFHVLDYTNWDSWEPNNSWGEDCIEMQYKDGKWNDEDCDNKRCFVCEKPAN
ncbi:C-type lectin domain family 19 member A-like [Asterias amurensis]|uniref:C-type lectin domain family 19 member A-like n=1 Tax=Asterias amurensis TaxID=7602 RepID=UPI003AB5FC6B